MATAQSDANQSSHPSLKRLTSNDPLPVQNRRRKHEKYTSQACGECKKRKNKCSGTKPCQRCKTYEVPCIYNSTNKTVETELIADSGQDLVLENLHQRNTRGESSDRASIESPELEYSEKIHRLPSNNNIHSSRNITPTRLQFAGPTSLEFNLDVANTTLKGMGMPNTGQDPGLAGQNSDSHGTESTANTLKNAQVSSTEADPLVRLSLAEVNRHFTLYETELNPLYPFIQIGVIKEKVNVIYDHLQKHKLLARQNNVNHKSLDFDTQDVQMVKIIVAMALALAPGPRGPTGRKLVDSVETAYGLRARDVPVDIKGLQNMTLMSIYYFHCDDEVLAWRTIGFAARIALELGLHRAETLEKAFPDPKARRWALRVFWCIYVLDKRWSFGTGMPFALQDSDIDPELSTLEDDAPYLHCLVNYGKIGSKVWNTVAGYGTARAHKSVVSHIDFQIQHWLNAVPTDFQIQLPKFGSVADDRPRELRKLSVLLYIRGNHMRCFIHRYNILSAANVRQNLAGARLVTDIAKDTIKVLAHLRNTSNIYQTDPGTFNYFLVAAVSAIFLAVCHAPAEFSSSCREEFLIALDLLKEFSGRSSSSQKLWKSVQSVKYIAPELGLVFKNHRAGPEGTENQPQSGLTQKTQVSIPLRSDQTSSGYSVVTNSANNSDLTSNLYSIPVASVMQISPLTDQNLQSNPPDLSPSTSWDHFSMPDVSQMNLELSQLFDILGDVNGHRSDVEYNMMYDQFLLYNGGEFSRIFEDLL